MTASFSGKYAAFWRWRSPRYLFGVAGNGHVFRGIHRRNPYFVEFGNCFPGRRWLHCRPFFLQRRCCHHLATSRHHRTVSLKLTTPAMQAAAYSPMLCPTTTRLCAKRHPQCCQGGSTLKIMVAQGAVRRRIVVAVNGFNHRYDRCGKGAVALGKCVAEHGNSQYNASAMFK